LFDNNLFKTQFKAVLFLNLEISQPENMNTSLFNKILKNDKNIQVLQKYPPMAGINTLPLQKIQQPVFTSINQLIFIGFKPIDCNSLVFLFCFISI